MFPVNQPSFHTSYYQFVTSTCNIATFHYKTWRTIVNIRFCSVNQIELYNLEPTHRSTNIKLNKQLPFRVVDYHIVRSPLPGPHINHRFNIRLSFTCPGTKNCYRTAFYPYFYATGSAPVSSDSGDSWTDYIPYHRRYGFTIYALPLTLLLHRAFAVGFPLQTESPLHSPLILHSLPDDFTVNDQFAITHFSHDKPYIASTIVLTVYTLFFNIL